MNNNITDEDRLNLKKLMNEMECENNTDKIRKLKHSKQLKEDINTFLLLKTKYKPDEIFEKSIIECNFST